MGLRGIRDSRKARANAAYYAAHRDRLNAACRAYQHANRDRLRRLARARYLAHRGENLKRDKEYRLNHREEIARRQRAYYVANREKLRAYNIAYHRANKAKMKEYRFANQEKIKARMHQRYCENRDAILAMRRAAYHRRNRDGGRNRYYVREYGVTLDHLRAMYDQQKGLCAVCGEPYPFPSGRDQGKTMAVDHDHKTGKVRKLLCGPCNMALGFMNDDPGRAEAIAEYARKHAGAGFQGTSGDGAERRA